MLKARSIAQNEANGLVELLLPAGDRAHGREIAAGDDKGLDLGPVYSSERLAGVFRTELPDRIGIGRAKAFECDGFEPVLGLEIACSALVHRVRIGRNDRDPMRPQSAQGPADRLRRGDRRNPGAGAHALRRHFIVVVGKQARRGLRQDHQLDLGGAEQTRLVVDVLVPARRKGLPRPARHQPPDMRLVGRRQQPAFHLDGRVGGRDQNAEMADHMRAFP